MPYTNITNPLDLETILVNTVSGTSTIFYFLAMIFFAYLAATFRMPNQVFLMMAGLFVILMATWFPILYGLFIYIMGFIVYAAISRAIKN